MEFEEEGYRFHPRDSELFTFLLRFIAEKDLSDNGFITECDVYKREPWKVDTKVISGVNSVVPRLDHEYKAVTPINIVEPMVQIQEASSGEEIIKEQFENDDPEITCMWNEDYGMNNHPINVVENPVMEVDDVEVQIQEAVGEESGVLEFENMLYSRCFDDPHKCRDLVPECSRPDS
uniref:NAC domain-containing protein n=1 Tax=Solanum tuberosum TaxID=4113 RepID=M1DBU3_SOLTU